MLKLKEENKHYFDNYFNVFNNYKCQLKLIVNYILTLFVEK